MAIFNQSSQAKKDSDPVPAFARDVPPATSPYSAPPLASHANTDFAPATPPRHVQAQASEVKESLIASGLTIEGKIEGSGHVRIAGRFKGDVNVQGDLTIEKGAKLNGAVRAKKVIVAGELEGNIDAAERVELLDTAVLTGDLKAGSLTVAAGSRIRGNVECGWDSAEPVAKANGSSRAKAEPDLVS